MNKTIFICICVLQAFLGFVEGKIVETSSMQDIVKDIKGKTWVLFDLDDTIMDSAHQLSSGPWISFYWSQFPLLFPNKREMIEKLMWTVNRKVPVKPIETITPELISQLQNKNNVVVMGLTARASVIAEDDHGNALDLTAQQLRSIGVDFQKSNYPKELDDRNSFNRGIIFTNGRLKGPVLREMISKVSEKPRLVIFIDDLPKHVISVDEEMKKEGIRCICYFYTAAEKMQREFDPLVGAIQLKYLLMHDQVISDAEAHQLKDTHNRKRMHFFLRQAFDHFEAQQSQAVSK